MITREYARRSARSLEERAQLHIVGEATNGLEAIAQAHALRPDVILMDVSMPQMDGIEATTRLRAELPSIEILGMSMQPGAEVRQAIGDAGASGFFVKDLDTPRLIEHLLVLHANIVLPMSSPPTEQNLTLTPNS